MKKQQFCFNCGEPLGVFDAYGDRYLECGAPACAKEARYQQGCDEAEVRERAEEDDYGRYR